MRKLLLPFVLAGCATHSAALPEVVNATLEVVTSLRWPSRTSIADCGAFAGDARSATWTQCPDHVVRAIQCGEHLSTCDCLEDGVHGTFFFATDPPLGQRPAATRVAAKCDW